MGENFKVQTAIFGIFKNIGCFLSTICHMSLALIEISDLH